jgi:hypothetical protein
MSLVLIDSLRGFILLLGAMLEGLLDCLLDTLLYILEYFSDHILSPPTLIFLF